MKPPFKRELTAEELNRLDDRDIDYSEIPPLDESFWKNARLRVPDRPKTQLTVRLDADIVDWFKAQGKGYQTRINAVLRMFYEAQTRR